MTDVKTLHLNDLAAVLAEASGISKAKAAAGLKQVVDTIVIQVLDEDGKVTIHGLGTFSVRVTDAREGNNPRKVGTKVKIPAKKKLVFKCSSTLRVDIDA